MQHVTSNATVNLTKDQRKQLRVAAIAANRDANVDDATLAAEYEAAGGDLSDFGIEASGQSGQSGQSGAEPSQDGAQNAQDGGQGEGEGEQGEPGESADSPADSLPEPPPLDGANPMDDHIRKIAREEDDWRLENQLRPAFTELAARVESAIAAASTMTAKAGPEPVSITVNLPGKKAGTGKTIENAHPMLEAIIRAIGAGVNVMLVGPAGSGKTTLAHQVAEALGLDFYFTGAIQMEHKLSGFIDANGVFQSTQFRQAFEHGGLFLFDEKDASSANAVLAFNAALANGFADFPDGQVKRHPDFVVIAACNTYGSGADRQYVGRNQQDAAAVDRYAVLDLDYDEHNEANWALSALGLDPVNGFEGVNPIERPQFTSGDVTTSDVQQWTTQVQRYRQAARAAKVRHVISPRASIMGAKLLAAGFPAELAEKMVIWKGLDQAAIEKVKALAA